MIAKHKALVIISISLAILLLVVSIYALHLYQVNQSLDLEIEQRAEGLLSPRVYSGLLPAKNYLIINFNPLKKELEKYVQMQNLSASITLVNLRDGASLNINEERKYYPASLNKLPIAMIIMQKVERRELGLEMKVPIDKEDRNVGWGDLYNTNRTQISIHELLEKLLQESDNTGQDILIDYVTEQDLTFLVNYTGYLKPTNNQDALLIDTQSMYSLFSSLYLSTILEPENSEYILQLLTNTTFNLHDKANLPPQTRIAQKFGSAVYDDVPVFHSCGILYTQGSKIFFCVMTQGLEPNPASEHVGVIVNKINGYVYKTRNQLDEHRERQIAQEP